MGILTKSTVVRGGAVPFYISKSEILNLPEVQASLYFADTDNWNIITFSFISTLGRQKKILTFKASETVPTTDFVASSSVRGTFKLVLFTIHDFDGGSLTIQRASLGVSTEFDVELPVIPSALFSRDFAGSPTLVANETLGGSGGPYGISALGVQLGGSGNGYNFYYRSVPAGFSSGILNYKVIVNYEITSLASEAWFFEFYLGSAKIRVSAFGDPRFAIGVHTEEFLLSGDASLNATFNGANSLIFVADVLRSQTIYIKSFSVELA
jgi:hypothetical protein